MNTPGLGNRPRGNPLLLARTWTLERESSAFGPCPSLSEQNNMCFSGDLQEPLLPDHDLTSGTKNTKKFVTTNHAPPSALPEKGFAESFGEFRVIWARATGLTSGHCNLPLFQTLMFDGYSALPCTGHACNTSSHQVSHRRLLK